MPLTMQTYNDNEIGCRGNFGGMLPSEYKKFV